MTIKFNIEQSGNETTVTVVWTFSDLMQALEHLKTLGVGQTSAPVTKPPKAAKKAAEPEPDDDEEEDGIKTADDDSDDSDDEDEDDAADEADDEDDDEEEEEKPKGTQVKITPALKEATKLREVVAELMKQGVTSKAKLVKVCHAIKSKVAVLDTVDIDVRVPKMAELLNPKAPD